MLLGSGLAPGQEKPAPGRGAVPKGMPDPSKLVNPPAPNQPATQPGQAGGTAQPTQAAPGQPNQASAGAPGGAGGTSGGAAGAVLPSIQTDDPETVTLSAFAEPVQLTSLIELLATTLNLNIVIKGEVTGSVVFNAPVSIPKKQLLGLVDALLEQHGYTITQDRTSFYTVRPLGEVTAGLEATTRLIPTPNVRPSALYNAISGQLGALGGTAGAPRALSAIDELGVLVVTDSPRRLDMVQSLIDAILAEHAKAQFIRIELAHIAAPVARERALQLVGQIPQAMARTGGATGQVDAARAAEQAALAGGAGASGGSRAALDNLGDRLTIDPQGNALFFRGVPGEIEMVKEVLALIDKPSALEPKRYEVGDAAPQVADFAQALGLGEVMTIAQQGGADQFGGVQNFGAIRADVTQAGGRSGRGAGPSGGSVIVVDQARGSLLYYATPEQHQLMDRLLVQLDPQSDQVVIRPYKVSHSDAAEVADIINGLLFNETPVATNELLPDGGGAGARRAGGVGRPATQASGAMRSGMGAGAEGELMLSGENAFVLAFKPLSTILVKAPARQQEDFRRLIEKLDVRRPQVYIEAQIVSVTWNDTLRLAFETQLINANGRDGLVQTNFGLTNAGASILDIRDVATGLTGLTAAIIKSDQLPIVINALQREADARVMSTPRLLVDDNEDAEIVSLDQQPTTSTSLGGTGGTGSRDVTSFGGFVDAGTTLKVTPQISGGGYLRLKYEIELSSFTGQPQNVNGTTIPSPKQTNTVKSESVTIPSDSTVVVGGLELDSKNKTIIKVPLLGDIPVVGHLFQDRNTGDTKTTLYIFLTPRVMRDPNFTDLRLLTRGPSGRVQLPRDHPELVPSAIDVLDLPKEVGASPARRPGRREQGGDEGE